VPRALVELPILLAIAVVVAFVLKTFVAQAYYIPSESMEPQLDVGDRVVVSKLSYELHDPHRGDIVVFTSPEKSATRGDDNAVVGFFKDVAEGIGLKEPDDDVLIKRVIGLPGETVEGKGGHVFINGQQLVEPYLPPDLATEDFAASTVPPDHLWVMGDNRHNSRDSHFFGAIPESSVVGRAIGKVWPPGFTSFL
jgi:signal peptidase I